MKTIALSMILSLAVIVCEQQTLFAPHFTTFDGLTAANPTNSLVPIAGVNRSVPLAGASYNPGKGASYNPGKGASYNPGKGASYNPGKGASVSSCQEPLPQVAGIPSCPEVRREEEEQPFDYDLGPMDINGGSSSFFSRGLH